MTKFLKDPLGHFLLAGLAIFLLFEAVGPEVVNERTIVVDRPILLRFIQYRTKLFEPEVAAARLDGLSDTERQALIDDYVREEVMHREAVALGLGEDDYIIRRRMVQKIDYITQGFSDQSVSVNAADVQAYYDANKQDYFVASQITFTHVFFDAERHGMAQATQMAEAELEKLKAENVAFSDAPKYGDRFPFHLNYVERDPEFVVSHFGAEMGNELFTTDFTPNDWLGVFISSYGAHLVKIAQRKEGYVPKFPEVVARVEVDYLTKTQREKKEQAIGRIVETYDVHVDL